MKRILLLLIFGLSIQIAFSQENEFNIGIEIRPRLLIDNGYRTPKTVKESTTTYITQRSRIKANLKIKNIETHISFQDVRFWGDDNIYKESGTYGNTESVSLHEAWFLINPFSNISVKIGRQLLQYDDQRIVATRNWNDYQVTYDALLFKFQDDFNKLDVVLSWNSSSNNIFYPEHKFKIFDLIRYERQLNNFNISGILLLSGRTISDSSKTIAITGTYGLNLKYSKNRTNIRSSVYLQNNLNAYGQKTFAYCFSIFLEEYIIENKFSVGLGIDYLSGQDETNTNTDYQNTNHRFNILYGQRHGWYGYMDYFSTTPSQGLEDYMIKAKYLPLKKLTLSFDFHMFRLAQNKYNDSSTNSKLNKYLGSEFDLTLKYKYSKDVTLQTAYSCYLTTNTLLQVKSITNEQVNLPQFFYFMIIVKPNLIHKNKQK